MILVSLYDLTTRHEISLFFTFVSPPPELCDVQLYNLTIVYSEIPEHEMFSTWHSFTPFLLPQLIPLYKIFTSPCLWKMYFFV